MIRIESYKMKRDMHICLPTWACEAVGGGGGGGYPVT